MTIQAGKKVQVHYVDALQRQILLDGTVHHSDPLGGGWWVELPLGIRILFREEQLKEVSDGNS